MGPSMTKILLNARPIHNGTFTAEELKLSIGQYSQNGKSTNQFGVCIILQTILSLFFYTGTLGNSSSV